jgi:proteic killer suppression protein
VVPCQVSLDMKFVFADSGLKSMHETGRGRLARRFPPNVVRAFFRVMLVVEAVRSVDELRQFRGLHYHALRGERSGQFAMRLNDQFRLIVRAERTRLVVIEITDYH